MSEGIILNRDYEERMAEVHSDVANVKKKFKKAVKRNKVKRIDEYMN